MSSKENVPSNNISPLPEEKMPECWKKDDRMNALFADFRNRSANPQDWSSKYKFWHELIVVLLSHYKCSVFSISELNIIFKRNGRIPMCLPTVIQEMHRNNEVIPEEEFLKNYSSTWTSWAVDLFVKKPLGWSISKAKSYISDQVISIHTKYIHLAIVEELGEIILSKVDNFGENTVISLTELLELCSKNTHDKSIDEKNLRLALIWLRNIRKAAIKGDLFNSKSEILVKLCRKDVKDISEIEEGVYKLKKQESLLIKKIELLEIEKKMCEDKAKSYVGSQLRHAAKNCLRKKHELDKCIDKRVVSLNNVQALLSRIHDAHSNSEMFDAYKVGCSILKKFEESGLTENNVRDTIDDLSEVMGELNDVQTALSEPALLEETDLELEKELQELLDTADSKGTTATTTSVTRDLEDIPDLTKLKLQDLPAAKKTAKTLSTT